MAADHSIIVQIGANITQLTQSLNSAQQQLQQFGGAFDAIKDVGKTLTGIGIAGAAGIGLAVNSAADFDTAMRKAGAIAGASASEFDAMKQAAKGFDANQTIAAMPGIISAAEASGEDLALTSDTVASALNIWGLEAADASKVADVLAESANSTAAGIEDMSYAFKYAGAPAAALGVSLEETSAAIGLMTNAGLDGSNAGTALRASLLALLNPSEENSKMMESMGIAITDAKGNFVGLSGLVENLSKSMEGQTDTQKAATLASLVGTEAVSGFLALMEAGPTKIDGMTASLENSAGASQEAAAKMKDGIGGAFEQLGGAVESLAISFGDKLVPAVTVVANFLSDLLTKFNGMSEGAKSFIAISAAVVAGLFLIGGPLLMIIGYIPSIIAGFATLSTAVGALGTVFTFLTGPVGLIISAIVALGVGVVAAYNHISWFRDGVNSAWEQIKIAFTTALEYIMSVVQWVMADISTFMGDQLAKIKAFWDENGSAIMTLVKTYFGVVQEYIQMVMGFLVGIFQASWPIIVGVIRAAWETIKALVATAIDLVLGVIQTTMKILQGDWEGAWESIKNTAMSIWKNITGIFENIDLASTGKNIINGLIGGISSMAGAVKDAVTGIAGKIKDGFTGFFDINSPSKVMKNDVGRWIPAGIADGIIGNISSVIAATKEMSKAIMPEAEMSLAYSTPTNSYSPRYHDVDTKSESRNSSATTIPRDIVIEMTHVLDSEVIGRKTERVVSSQQGGKIAIKNYMRGN